MIPTVLPPPAAPPAASRAGAGSPPDAGAFDDALRAVVDTGRPTSVQERAEGSANRPEHAAAGPADARRDRDEELVHDADVEDGEVPSGPEQAADGREQALAAVPEAAPAVPVLAGLAADNAAETDAAVTAGTAEADGAGAAPAAVTEDSSVPTEPRADTSTTTLPDAEPLVGTSTDAEGAPIDPDATQVETEPTPADASEGADADVATATSADSDAGVDAGGDRAARTAPADERAAGSGAGATDDGNARRGAEPSTGRAAGGPGAPLSAAEPARAPGPAPEVVAHVDATPAPAPIPTASPTTAAAASPAAPAPPTVAQQLVEHVTPLVAGPDGSHELTIELRPATLGRVQLEVTLEDGVLHVRVNADDPSSRRLLAQALGDLRADLADAGIATGNLDVGDPRTQDRRGDADTAPRRGGAAGAGTTDPTPARRAPVDARSALDVLL